MDTEQPSEAENSSTIKQNDKAAEQGVAADSGQQSAEGKFLCPIVGPVG